LWNIFLPQSIQSQIELEEIADVKRQIISPSTSRTTVGIVQDGLLGAYTLTSPATRIDWRSAMNIMSYTSIDDFSSFKKDKEYTGHEIFSLIIPPGINISKGPLQLKNGILESGRLNKDILGSKKKNAIHQLIWDEYGAEETKEFIDDTQRLINNYNLHRGFTVGYGDAIISNEIKDQITKLFKSKEQIVNHMITEIENNPDLMEKETFEFKLFQELYIIREDVSTLLMNNLDPENNFNIMITSGSKGSVENMGQISGCLGLVTAENNLFPMIYNNRTFAYYHRNDDRGESRGLVSKSFIAGLEFPNFIIHLQASREGLIDQAIKTANSGYAQRKLVKSMEDIMVKYDGTVRTANDTLLQPIYGDSGADTTKQYEYTIKFIEMSNKDLENKHKFTSEELKDLKDYKEKDNNSVYELIKFMRDDLRTGMIKAKANFVTKTDTFMIPVNISRILGNKLHNKKLEEGEKVTASYVLDKLESILDNEVTTLMCMTQKVRKNKKSLKNRDELVGKTLFKCALYDSLSPKRCVVEYKLSKKQFDSIITEIVGDFNKNIVQPGEMVGLIGAQAMGEPLNSVGGKNELPLIADK